MVSDIESSSLPLRRKLYTVDEVTVLDESDLEELCGFAGTWIGLRILSRNDSDRSIYVDISVLEMILQGRSAQGEAGQR